MRKNLLLQYIAIFLLFSVSTSGQEVFYVKPSGPKTECPSGNSPCHSLQYYANHSSFTNNSRFLFLEGEHHLEGVVTIRNVADLSLVGADSSGVKIVCKSLPSGFHVEEFASLIMANMSITSSCGSGVECATVLLVTGNEATLDQITMSGIQVLVAANIVGSFAISNSNFFPTSGSNVTVSYHHCYRPCYFSLVDSKFNTIAHYPPGLSLLIYCSDVHALITGSSFESGEDISTGLLVNYNRFANNTVFIERSTFNSSIVVLTCGVGVGCSENDLQCSNNIMKFTNSSFNAGVTIEIEFETPTKDCTLIMEDTVFRDKSLRFYIGYVSTTNNTDPHAVLSNVTFANIDEESTFKINKFLFISCTFENNTASALRASSSELVFRGYNLFKNNSALIGGGILLVSAHIHLESHAQIMFENNHAAYVGGAIYITDPLRLYKCFFAVDPSTSTSTAGVGFVNNTADYAGSSVYGMKDGSCCRSRPCKEFLNMFNTSNTDENPSAVASDPDDVCFCEDGRNQPNCSDDSRAYSIHAFPGQEFPIRLAVVGANYGYLGPELVGVVPGAVRAYFDSSFSYVAKLGESQSSQVSDRSYCVNFNYSISTNKKTVMFKLVTEQHFFETLSQTSPPTISYDHVSVTVHLKDCPPGFILSSKCICDPVLSSHGITCFINDQSILRPANSWIGFMDISTDSNETGVMFHPNCPISYCLHSDVNITSNTSDSQCQAHRTGMLCGKCEENFSLTLGDGKCVECANTYLLILLPLALSGLLLVALLFTLNLTITEGSINGLIFYANVIGMNHIIFFSEESTHLYMFLAWLNLDLGISTCLYDGMDAYVETWLQFLFPLYLWVIVLVIILLYRKFPTLANRFGGQNAVKVLATLLLLSYTKLQRTVITIMSFSELEFPDGTVHYVWLYDANLKFLSGKHLFLGFAGILTGILIVLYTLCLAFFQQLQAYSGYRAFQWVNKLKPVFDAYAGPYKDKCRFWTGVLLIVRTVLVVIFTINTKGYGENNLLAILVVSCALLLATSNGVYKKWPYNYLETFFYIQLITFAGGSLYARQIHNGNITAVADTSIALTLVAFLGVLGYHIVIRIKNYCHLKGIPDMNEYQDEYERIED